MLLRLQLDLCSILFSRSFSQGRRQLDKNSLPYSVKWFNAPTISRLMLLGIKMFRGAKLPKTRYKLIVGATTVERRDITPTDATIYVPVPIRLLLLHLPQLVEPTLLLLLPSKTMPFFFFTCVTQRSQQRPSQHPSTVRPTDLSPRTAGPTCPSLQFLSHSPGKAQWPAPDEPSLSSPWRPRRRTRAAHPRAKKSSPNRIKTDPPFESNNAMR
jgi:hypothetical protein